MAEQLGVDLSLVKGSGAGGQIMKEDVEAFAAGKSQAPAVTEGGRIVATPAAKKLAQDKQVDLHQVKGSGPEGRIVMADVNTYSAAAPKQPAPVTPTPQPQVAPAAPAPAAIPGDTRKPLTRIRQTIAQRMTNSKTTVPHFYITVAVEMDAALKLREQVNEALKSENIKVSVNDLIVRATAVALRRFPNLNSSFAGDAIVQHEQVHVGVAVALPSGLVTVTVRDADVKTLRQIAVEMSGLAARARDGKAQPGDMGGQTFTISNLGMYGVESFVAIVNPPDAGILAVGSSTPTPVVRDGQVTVRNIMHVTLSGDHRVTDGAEGAQFVNEIKRILENPWGLVL
jgi:pyruvate dehydrogenase E2 component (dihydrolipoamide acetyltransferase)